MEMDVDRVQGGLNYKFTVQKSPKQTKSHIRKASTLTKYELKHRKPKRALIKHILYKRYSTSSSTAQVNLLLYFAAKHCVIVKFPSKYTYCQRI